MLRKLQFSLPLILLTILNLNDLRAQESLNTTYLGELYYQSIAHGVAVCGSYAYIANWYGGLRVVDISDPSAPVEVGYCDTPGNALSVAVSGSYAYVADDWAGLRVVDISNPSNPVELGFCDTPGDAKDVALSFSYAYVADGASGLSVVNILNPAEPLLMGSCDTPGNAKGVATTGSYAYVADSEAGLRIISISNPYSPVEASYYDTPGYARDVAVEGSYCYVADGSAGLRIVHISNPYTPVEVGFGYTPGSAWGVAVSGFFAYVADYFEGLQIFCISDPLAPIEVGYYDTPGVAYEVAISYPFAYMADGQYFGVYQFSLPDIAISLVPFSIPILIPPMGGRFDYYAFLTNYEVVAQPITIWIETILPDSTVYYPLASPLVLILSPGTTGWQRAQNVPGAARPGNYWYECHVGYYPSVTLDASGFAFTKTSLGSTESGECLEDWVVAAAKTLAPEAYSLSQNYPNPFNPVTVISYKLPTDSFVHLRIYDTAGRLVATLVNGWREAGRHQVTWDASGLPSELYFCRMQAGDFSTVKKVALIK